VLSGLAAGAGLLGLVRWKLSPSATFMGHTDSGARTSALVFLVLFVHSRPRASRSAPPSPPTVPGSASSSSSRSRSRTSPRGPAWRSQWRRRASPAAASSGPR
jgi:hypothetical protein